MQEGAKKVICPQCGKEFETRRDWQHFCTDECRTEHHNNLHRQAIEHYRTCPLAGAAE